MFPDGICFCVCYFKGEITVFSHPGFYGQATFLRVRNLYGSFDGIIQSVGKETAKAMEGMGIYLDKKPVGKIIAPAVNDELGRIDRRKT